MCGIYGRLGVRYGTSYVGALSVVLSCRCGVSLILRCGAGWQPVCTHALCVVGGVVWGSVGSCGVVWGSVARPGGSSSHVGQCGAKSDSTVSGRVVACRHERSIRVG